MSTRQIIKPEMLRVELDPLWPRLTDAARTKASAWVDVTRRMAVAQDKGAELIACRTEYSSTLGGMGRGTVYRRMAGLRERGLEGVLSKSELQRATRAKANTSLPPEFVEWWQGLCGLHQRRKVLSVWRHLMRDHLIAGRMIPGYNTNWRGIWAAENAGSITPNRCPYTDIHAGPAARAPYGWGYRTLVELAPDKDVWEGVTIGVHAMQAHNPTVPHTRVGLRPMQVITMDDVTLDAFCWYPGEREPRRPIGLGVMDILTARMVSWGLVPVRQRSDGTSVMLDGLKRRYIDAHIFCGIGIDQQEGILMLLEHGAAGMSPTEEERINAILGQRADGGPWLRVQRSSTSGAPILQGMFRERGRGRPTHKAIIESAWNLLHNEAAMLPAPSGKDWDTAPMDTSGWQSEDRALIKAASQVLARECPDAIKALMQARTHALTYHALDTTMREILTKINDRRDHSLEGWEGCGFVRPVVEIGGTLVDLSTAARDLAGDNSELEALMLSQMSSRSMPARMTPDEAWSTITKSNSLKRFSPFVATRILGPETAQCVEVSRRRQFVAIDEFSGEKLVYAARCLDEVGRETFLQPGDQVDVWVNPFSRGMALVCRPDGSWLGAAAYMPATTYGSADSQGNIVELARFRHEQKDRLYPAASLKKQRKAARDNTNVAALRIASQAPADEANEMVEMMAAQAQDGIFDAHF